MRRNMDCPTCGADMEADLDERVNRLEREAAILREAEQRDELSVKILEKAIIDLLKRISFLQAQIDSHLAEQEERGRD